jgi:predicted dehydrogenase
VFNPTNPHMYHRFRVGDRREHIKGYTTYHHQLEAFLAAVRTGAPILTPPSDSIANMVVIDAIYRAAGLHPRPGGTD